MEYPGISTVYSTHTQAGGHFEHKLNYIRKGSAVTSYEFNAIDVKMKGKYNYFDYMHNEGIFMGSIISTST